MTLSYPGGVVGGLKSQEFLYVGGRKSQRKETACHKYRKINFDCHQRLTVIIGYSSHKKFGELSACVADLKFTLELCTDGLPGLS